VDSAAVRFFPVKGLTKRLEYLAVRLVIGGINRTPISAASWIARAIGGLLYLAAPHRRRTAIANLTIAYGDTLSLPEKQKLARESFQNFATSLAEFFRISQLLRGAEQRFVFEGTEHLDRAFQKNHGVILVISHLGSWECLSFLPYLRGYPCSVVVREVRNPYLYRWIQRLRLVTRLNPIDRKDSVREVLSELKKNHLVAILIDQWAGHDGVWVDFFGKPTSTTSIPARLARKTGASLIPAYCLRTGCGRYKIRVLPAAPLDSDPDEQEKKTTLLLNRILEAEILKYPEQWIWGHERWKGRERHVV